ncbi:arginine deiminase-related protein [Bacteroidales bacterium MB20-C3-3]|nr:arginine deiminase-related protein [Bacteroidales bacterium MB20-C3-3]
MQSTSKVLMVRPVRFGFNEQTAGNNSFQKRGYELSAQDMALEEFDNFVSLLRANNVEVVVVEDTPEPHTPDSIFPNNWFSTHASGELVLYPMCAPNRRLERKESVLNVIKEIGERGKMRRIVDLTHWESENLFLEGTGSLIFDRKNRIVFACRSPRCDIAVLEDLCEKLDYEFLDFGAYDRDGKPIYHTNVMMCVGDKFVVACLDSIKNIDERTEFISFVEDCDKELIEISIDQMEQFAGNMLQLRSTGGEPLLIMSATAKRALTTDQLESLMSYCKIISPELESIETNGGGSARCMLAEIFF